MRIIILLLLVFNCIYAQPSGSGVEIRLVEGANPYDSNLLNILNAHFVNIYQVKAGHPIPELQGRIYQAQANGNLNTLMSDLNNYPSVVESAMIADASSFNDSCYAKILNSQVGIPIGFNGNIVLTNDAGLNDIFQTFNVYYYAQAFPSAISESLLRGYNVVCNCDVQQLKSILESYNSVIESTENSSAAYLSLNNLSFIQLKVYPNPFTSDFFVESNNEILNLHISDITAKLIVRRNTLSELQNEVQNIGAGIYFLKIQFTSGLSVTKKVIKL